MEALRLAIILTIVVVCVLAATRPDSGRRQSRRSAERVRRGNEATPRHRFRIDRGVAVQRNRWDRPDLDRAIGRDYDDVDAAFTAWPTS